MTQALRADRSSVFKVRALDHWPYQRRIELRLIAAGKPTQIAYMGCFNDQFRVGRLDERGFGSLVAPGPFWRCGVSTTMTDTGTAP